LPRRWRVRGAGGDSLEKGSGTRDGLSRGRQAAYAGSGGGLSGGDDGTEQDVGRSRGICGLRADKFNCFTGRVLLAQLKRYEAVKESARRFRRQKSGRWAFAPGRRTEHQNTARCRGAVTASKSSRTRATGADSGVIYVRNGRGAMAGIIFGPARQQRLASGRAAGGKGRCDGRLTRAGWANAPGTGYARQSSLILATRRRETASCWETLVVCAPRISSRSGLLSARANVMHGYRGNRRGAAAVASCTPRLRARIKNWSRRDPVSYDAMVTHASTQMFEQIVRPRSSITTCDLANSLAPRPSG